MLKSLKDRSKAKKAEKDVVIGNEHNSRVREQSQPELNNVIGEESTQMSPISDNYGCNVVTPRRKGDVHVEESRLEEINECNDDLGGDVQVNPSVKDTSGEASYKTTKSHNSVEPTVVEILTESKGKRVKRVLRK
ncbi:hypothetical protein LIER_06975 [Lithospermum erythrorhizon]|uniref:Uncharacterized protein n=1 Tax=Lithospermum erythrorhizon TaxID=34254 RepID=A0AAV3PB67_LITER